MESTLLDNVKQLLNLGVGDIGRLEHIKSSLEENKTLYSSDMNYVGNLIEQHIVNQEISDQTIKQDETTRLQSENIKLKNDIAKLQVENSQSKPTLPKADSGIGSKITTISSVIGVISVILLIVVFMPQTNERSKGLDQELVDATLDLLDVCVNTKTLGDIVSCDKSIDNENISKVCKDNNVKECDAKIAEYYDTRDSRIQQAHSALNSATRNLIQACSDFYDPTCDQKLMEIKNFCEQYRNTVAYLEVCDSLYSDNSQVSSTTESDIFCGQGMVLTDGICQRIESTIIDPFCKQLQNRENKIIAEYGPGSDELNYFLETNKDDLNDCRK